MPKYLIITRSWIYNGVTEGVLFQNGRAIVEDEFIKNLLVVNYGYIAELIKDEAEKKQFCSGR
ncbi:hypothetical protein Dtox_2150 [Desulfofarcimen acetoxidans DSM 771]|jgi:hypothetical protein|uniref:Uncharacterized protein n=1 Tax=Desulfofarcimen acetoxidans (strain ATCC 49208 / DSM 771 / KCTC 5769 / VKM B-1644 / 5575) TaxID=485916 RepID=C8VZ67_DESAS|nr:hypothetical protein [Desulfofarcimen acetoxidans]ACV62977.1 hypothetical protein Dtox_2150 [Desulfofarcimen acetoxidans DSM 771]